MSADSSLISSSNCLSSDTGNIDKNSTPKISPPISPTISPSLSPSQDIQSKKSFDSTSPSLAPPPLTSSSSAPLSIDVTSPKLAPVPLVTSVSAPYNIPPFTPQSNSSNSLSIPPPLSKSSPKVTLSILKPLTTYNNLPIPQINSNISSKTSTRSSSPTHSAPSASTPKNPVESNSNSNSKITSKNNNNSSSYSISLPLEEDLIYSTQANNLDRVKYILDNNPNLLDYIDPKTTDSPLTLACRLGYEEITEYLLEKGAKNDPHPEYGQTALHIAIEKLHNGCTEIILIEASLSNSDVIITNLADSMGQTPLHTACISHNEEAIELLLKHGANIDSLDNYKQSPLHLSAGAYGNSKILAILLDHGGDEFMEMRDTYGNTPLHHAAFHGNIDCVKLLLETAAESNTKNFKQLTPYKLAIMRNHQKVASLLLEYRNNPQSSTNSAVFLDTITLQPQTTNSSSDHVVSNNTTNFKRGLLSPAQSIDHFTRINQPKATASLRKSVDGNSDEDSEESNDYSISIIEVQEVKRVSSSNLIPSNSKTNSMPFKLPRPHRTTSSPSTFSATYPPKSRSNSISGISMSNTFSPTNTLRKSIDGSDSLVFHLDSLKLDQDSNESENNSPNTTNSNPNSSPDSSLISPSNKYYGYNPKDSIQNDNELSSLDDSTYSNDYSNGNSTISYNYSQSNVTIINSAPTLPSQVQTNEYSPHNIYHPPINGTQIQSQQIQSQQQVLQNHPYQQHSHFHVQNQSVQQSSLSHISHQTNPHQIYTANHQMNQIVQPSYQQQQSYPPQFHNTIPTPIQFQQQAYYQSNYPQDNSHLIQLPYYGNGQQQQPYIQQIQPQYQQSYPNNFYNAPTIPPVNNSIYPSTQYPPSSNQSIPSTNYYQNYPHPPHSTYDYHQDHKTQYSYSDQNYYGNSQYSAEVPPLEVFYYNSEEWHVYMTEEKHIYYLKLVEGHSQWEDPRVHGVLYDSTNEFNRQSPPLSPLRHNQYSEQTSYH